MTAPQPAPAAADARGVVVDAAALYVVCDGLPGPGRDAAFVEVEDADGYSHGADVGIAWEEHPSVDGMYRLGPFRALIATARPLPTAAGAVDAASAGAVSAARIADWREVADFFDATGCAPVVYALRAACDALASATPAVPAPDRAAVEAAIDVLLNGPYDSFGEFVRARSAFIDRWFTAPAHDADAAGENGGAS